MKCKKYIVQTGGVFHIKFVIFKSLSGKFNLGQQTVRKIMSVMKMG